MIWNPLNVPWKFQVKKIESSGKRQDWLLNCAFWMLHCSDWNLWVLNLLGLPWILMYFGWSQRLHLYARHFLIMQLNSNLTQKTIFLTYWYNFKTKDMKMKHFRLLIRTWVFVVFCLPIIFPRSKLLEVFRSEWKLLSINWIINVGT
jgi:hypothetical protein